MMPMVDQILFGVLGKGTSSLGIVGVSLPQIDTEIKGAKLAK